MSNGVKPDVPDDYTVSYSVPDSDGNTATMDTTVHVLSADSTDSDWYVKRVYQNPNTWNTRELLRMNRDDYMDLQMIGVHVPAGKSIDVSFLDSPSTLAMTLDCPTNDSKTDGTRTSISSGKTVTLKASDSIDTIPMIKTPMLPRGEGTRHQDIRNKVEYSDDDGIGAVHFWTDGDDEKAFIDSWSADGTHPFAYIETRAFEGMPTWRDLSTIKRLGTMNGWAASLTAWSDYSNRNGCIMRTLLNARKKFKASAANTTVYIHGKPLPEIDWKAYAGKSVNGTAYVADTDGNTAEVAITLNVGKAKQDGNGNGNGTSDSGNGGNGNAQDSPSDGTNGGTQGGNAAGNGTKGGDDTLNPSGWKMPKNPRKRKALVQMGVAGGIEAIAVIVIGSIMLIAAVARKRRDR